MKTLSFIINAFVRKEPQTMVNEKMTIVDDLDMDDAALDEVQTPTEDTTAEIPMEEPSLKAPTAEEPEHIIYGEEQWRRCVDALAVELEHLFDGDGRDRLAVRCMNKLNPDMKVLVGVYDRAHGEQLVEDLANINTAAYMVWATLNPFDTTVRTTNRLEPGYALPKKAITRACWLLLDFDPHRPKETEATGEEREMARLKMEEVRTYLMTTWEFPEPVVVMSGNGYQLKFRVDLPADTSTEQLLKRVLSILDAQYSDNRVDIDTSVWDLPRVCKIPGTYSRKGLPTAERPQCLAYTVSRPTTLEPIAAETLQHFVAAHAELVETVHAAEATRQEREYREYDTQRQGTGYLTVEEAHARVQAWCQRHSTCYRTDTSDGVKYYRLDRCLFLEASADAQAHRVTEHNAKLRSVPSKWPRSQG